eukprot:scaffold176213_cov23-Cyclotella_meneghiniana.AAC.1
MASKFDTPQALAAKRIIAPQNLSRALELYGRDNHTTDEYRQQLVESYEGDSFTQKLKNHPYRVRMDSITGYLEKKYPPLPSTSNVVISSGNPTPSSQHDYSEISQVKARTMAKEDLQKFITACNSGKILFKRFTIDNFEKMTTIQSVCSSNSQKTFQTGDGGITSPNVISNSRSWMCRDSSCIFDIVTSSARNPNILSSTCLHDSYSGFHFQQPSFHPRVNALSLNFEPIDMIDRIQGGIKQDSYYTNFTNNPEVIAMWHHNENLNEPPINHITSNIYGIVSPNMEVQPDWTILRDRMHPIRWSNSIEWFCTTMLGMQNYGRDYFIDGIGLKRLLPGNMQSKQSILSQMHHHDRQFAKTSVMVPAPNPAMMTNIQIQQYYRTITQNPNPHRHNHLLNNMDTFESYQQNPGFIPTAGIWEEGQHCYIHSSFLMGWLGHLTKEDRIRYNTLPQGTEFYQSLVCHMFKSKDIYNAECIPLNTSVGQEQLLKTRLPITYYASMHIVNGPPNALFTGAKIIKFYDCYRPMKTLGVGSDGRYEFNVGDGSKRCDYDGHAVELRLGCLTQNLVSLLRSLRSNTRSNFCG